MPELLQHLLLTNLFLVLFFVFYKLFLARDTHFQLNRVYLIGSALLAFLLPLVELPSILQPAEASLNNVLPTFSLGEVAPTVAQPNWTGWDLFWLVYGLGMLLVTVRFSWGLLQIVRLVRKFGATDSNEFKLVELPEHYSTFSFGNILFWSQTDEATAIRKHELVHIRQGHTFDLLLIELMGVVCWFNPVIRGYRQSLQLVHEYIADREVLREDTTLAHYSEWLLQQALQVDTLPLTHNFFNQSTIKQRFTMMKKTPTSRRSLWKLGLAAPLLASMIGLTVACSQEPGIDLVADVPVEAAPDVMAEYPGGQSALFEYLGNAIKYTKEAKEKSVEGTVQAQFKISDQGEVYDISIKRGLGYGLDEVVVDMLETMPNWTPGTKNGKNVATSLILPIQFRLAPDPEAPAQVPPPPPPPVDKPTMDVMEVEEVSESANNIHKSDAQQLENDKVVVGRSVETITESPR